MGDLYVGPWPQPCPCPEEHDVVASPQPKESCFTCIHAMFGAKGTYCSLYEETILNELAECEGYELDRQNPPLNKEKGTTT